MTKEQHSVIDYILIIDWRWMTAATAKEDYAASHRYRQQQQPQVWSQIQQQQLLVGAVELNAYWLLGTTEGTATERAKTLKKRRTNKRNDKERSKKSKHLRDSLTVWRFSSTARAWETGDEARATAKEARAVQFYRYSSTSNTSSTRRCSYLDTATGSSHSSYI